MDIWRITYKPWLTATSLSLLLLLFPSWLPSVGLWATSPIIQGLDVLFICAPLCPSLQSSTPHSSRGHCPCCCLHFTTSCTVRQPCLCLTVDWTAYQVYLLCFSWIIFFFIPSHPVLLWVFTFYCLALYNVFPNGLPAPTSFFPLQSMFHGLHSNLSNKTII